MQFCWALLGQLELQVIILCRFIISNLFYIVIWYTNIYWWIFQNYRVNKVGLECGGRVDTKHNASSSSVNMSPSESSSLQSFVSGCLWLWANLLEAKCLYLGQLRIRSHVVSATLAHMLPQNFLTTPPHCISLSTMTQQNGWIKMSSQESRWCCDKRQMSLHNTVLSCYLN